MPVLKQAGMRRKGREMCLNISSLGNIDYYWWQSVGLTAQTALSRAFVRRRRLVIKFVADGIHMFSVA